jgi:hypothetical protein
VLIFSLDGRLLWKRSDVILRPPLSEASLDRVRPGKIVFETVKQADGGSSCLHSNPPFR